MKTSKKLICAALALITLGGLSGCGQNNSTETKSTEVSANTNASAGELKELDVVLDWYPNAVHAFIYDAIEKGYYEEEGLKVNIQFPSNANDALSLVAAKKADLGVYYMQDVITTKSNQNIPVKAVASIVQDPMNIFLSLKEKNITSPKDLNGKMIGYGGTELSEAITKYAVENAGGTYDQSKVIDVGFDLMASMTTGQVDATVGCLLNHEVPQMEEEGFEVNYFTLEECGIPSYYELVFVANDEQIANDSETLKAFLRASKKGFEDMKSDPKATLKILLDNQNAENFPLSESVETQSMNTLLPSMEKEGSPFLSQTEEAWQKNIDWLFEQGLIAEKKDVSEFMTTELMP